MKIALAQINPTVGDLPGNAARHREMIAQARAAGAALVIFPELSLLGYPPKDLLLKPRFIDENVRTLKELATHCVGITALVGFACRHHGDSGRALHNAAALLKDGKTAATYYKQLLPTYDVFDESRYFQPAASQQVIDLDGIRLGLTVCEDIWNSPEHGHCLYHQTPMAELADEKVDWVVNMSASPFVAGKHEFRLDLFSRQCRKYAVPLVYVNQVGGNDELVFDGNSCVLSADGELLAAAKDFQEDLLIVDLQTGPQRRETCQLGIASVHDALVLGLRDYVRKCGFRQALVGLSGGIDSAVTVALAVEALGRENVLGVAMPSRYSSDHSIADAQALAQNLNIAFETVPIEKAHRAFEEMLAGVFADTQPDISEENIQARIRGTILMAMSNKFGRLLLTTGNKSEVAVGYCTLYGDMAGGLAVISDVPKTMVYDLAKYLNRSSEVVPVSTITKPPSAELRPDQMDQDSLPPYDVLDDILQRYVEQEQGSDEIIAAGFDQTVVQRVISLVDHNEYKRKQAAPGLKVTSRAFGFGRRMPIAQRYRG